MTDIPAKRTEIEQRLKENQAERMIIEAELLGLQHVCQHKNVRKWKHHDYAGDTDLHWHCDDCGLHKIS